MVDNGLSIELKLLLAALRSTIRLELPRRAVTCDNLSNERIRQKSLSMLSSRIFGEDLGWKGGVGCEVEFSVMEGGGGKKLNCLCVLCVVWCVCISSR